MSNNNEVLDKNTGATANQSETSAGTNTAVASMANKDNETRDERDKNDARNQNNTSTNTNTAASTDAGTPNETSANTDTGDALTVNETDETHDQSNRNEARNQDNATTNRDSTVSTGTGTLKDDDGDLTMTILNQHGDDPDASVKRPNMIALLGNFPLLNALSYRSPVRAWIPATTDVNHHDVKMRRITDTKDGLVTNMLKTKDPRTITKDSAAFVFMRGIPSAVYNIQEHGARVKDGVYNSVARSSMCFERSRPNNGVDPGLSGYYLFTDLVLAFFRKKDFQALMGVLGLAYSSPRGINPDVPADESDFAQLARSPFATK